MVVTKFPSEPYTVEDVDAMPDDGRRHELIDGVLIVTPAPRKRHQVALSRLHVAIAAVLPDHLLVLEGPYDWRVSRGTKLQPDLLIVPRLGGEEYLDEPPPLVVEVLSPSTRRYDLHTKRDAYDSAGAEAYWTVDPDEPSITVMERVDGRGPLVVVSTANGFEEVSVRHPVALTLRPSDLVA